MDVGTKSKDTIKKKPKKIDEMTKEQIRQAIIKKRECNTQALLIVESLLDKCINKDYFVSCLPNINQSHFEDVIEERSILQLCGYPLCQERVSEKDVPKQKYRISIKTNKVYDITARKYFCSNACYKSAMNIKKQMLTSPLWFREYEEIPEFHILPLDSVGSLGQEVDLKLIEKIEIKNEKKFTSINDFTSVSLNEIKDSHINNIIEKSDNDIKQHHSNNDKFQSIQMEHNYNQNIVNKISENTIVNEIKTNNNKKELPNKLNPLNIVGEIIEKPQAKIDPILLTTPCNIIQREKELEKLKKSPQKREHLLTTFTIEVEKCLAEWFTIDTLILLFGENKVKEMVADKGECIKEYLNNHTSSIFYNSNSYDQYQSLCRKLNMLELEDKFHDAQTVSKITKPLPDYAILQEESKKMQLKVKAFFSGDTEIAEPQQLESKTDDEQAVTQLPLVDKNAQNAIRRRIVCEHLNKVLPDLLRSLGLSTLTISSDIRLLVNTFRLKANNIMFKPIQWTLIAIIFINLLSLRNPRLKHLLEQSTAFNHMQLLLLSYQQDGGYFERLIEWLTDIDRLLDVNDTQLTIA